MAKQKADRGNSYADQAAFDKAMYQRGIKLMRFEEAVEKVEENDLFTRSMTVKFPNDLKTGYTIVLRAENGDGKYVTFNGGETFEEALVGLINRMFNGSLVWKEDQYG